MPSRFHTINGAFPGKPVVHQLANLRDGILRLCSQVGGRIPIPIPETLPCGYHTGEDEMPTEALFNCEIADHHISCFSGAIYRGRRRRTRRSHRVNPSKSWPPPQDGHPLAGPDRRHLTSCLVRPDRDLWHELDLGNFANGTGASQLPCILTGSRGLPVWWLGTGYEAPGTTIVIGLPDLLSLPRAHQVDGRFVSAHADRETLRLVTSSGAHLLDPKQEIDT